MPSPTPAQLVVANARSYGDLDNRVLTAPVGSMVPTDLTSDWDDAWMEFGWLDDSGIVETPTVNETKIYGWQGGALLKVLRNQAEHTFALNALEENAVTLGLIRPGSTTTTTGGVNITDVKPNTARNIRMFGIELFDGEVTHRFVCQQGEVTPTGSITYVSSALVAYGMTINCYVDATGSFFQDINDNPLLAQGLFS